MSLKFSHTQNLLGIRVLLRVVGVGVEEWDRTSFKKIPDLQLQTPSASRSLPKALMYCSNKFSGYTNTIVLCFTKCFKEMCSNALKILRVGNTRRERMYVLPCFRVCPQIVTCVHISELWTSVSPLVIEKTVLSVFFE